MNNIAIAHKDYAVRGGGETLVEELASLFDAPLYIGNKAPDSPIKYDDVTLVETTRKQRWMINRGGTLRAIGYMAAWENEDRLGKYDTVITSGNEPLWYVPKSDQTLVAYCHSPPRELYDLNHNTGAGTLGTLLRAGKRSLFRPNVDRPDLWVANGEEVARRLNQSWDVSYDDIRVVYPPVETEVLRPENAATEDFYLYLGRLAHNKRIELAIRACNELERSLIVAGKGPEKESLEALAGPTVDVVGYVSEGRKQELLAGAKAMLMPAENEDFGIAPVEALASGTPVLGVQEGMTQEQIKDGKNGLYANSSADGFIQAIRTFEDDGIAWDGSEIRADTVARFGIEQFRDGMVRAVQEAQKRSRVPVDKPPERVVQ